VGGFRLPNPANEEAFNNAVEAVSAATQTLLARLEASPDQSTVLAGRLAG